MHFIDEVVIEVASGPGGAGCVAWRRESHVPRGGPAGGNGGAGGDVVFLADVALHTLLDLRYKKHFKAEGGVRGGGQNKTGAHGEDCVIRVPAGTMVFDADTNEALADLVQAGQRSVVVEGGVGGKGNAHFSRATHRAPEQSTEGGPSVVRRLRLELKLLADVGLVGFPNAGKSTLISRISRARPRIADYPFTTLEPNLGVVEVGDREPFVVADVPGLVEGAHEGVGLGHRFLRHIERTAVLVYLLDHDSALGRDALEMYRTLRQEVSLYDDAVAARPSLIVLNKLDVLADRAVLDTLAVELEGAHQGLYGISAVTGEGLERLLHGLADAVEMGRKDEIGEEGKQAFTTNEH